VVGTVVGSGVGAVVGILVVSTGLRSDETDSSGVTSGEGVDMGVSDGGRYSSITGSGEPVVSGVNANSEEISSSPAGSP
jgi:hypothetical protein